jgi:hypothetical protein
MEFGQELKLAWGWLEAQDFSRQKFGSPIAGSPAKQRRF